MRSTFYPEGLTFEEWVCSAGIAVFDAALRVQPYATSTSMYKKSYFGFFCRYMILEANHERGL